MLTENAAGDSKSKNLPEKRDDISTLRLSFEDFTRASQRIRRAYQRLGKKFEKLNAELERKNIELERAVLDRQRLANYLRSILESLTTGVIVTDGEDRATIANGAAASLLDCSVEEIAGKPLGALCPALMERLRSPKIPGEGTTAKKILLGRRFVDVTINSLTEEGNEAGRIVVLRDVTDIEKMEERAKRSETLAAMGQLAAGIAHELRNPLGSLDLFASLVRKDVPDEKNRERLSRMIDTIQEIDRKISNLLRFTRKQPPVMRTLNLHEVLEEALSFSRRIMTGRRIDFSVRFGEGLPLVEGDEELLKQVFLNLLLNALQAMPEGGSLSVKTAVTRKTQGRSDDSVVVRLTDTGEGIPEDCCKKIFTPFFTTREQGAGLGLTIAHNIVEIHGGTLDLERSEPGATIFSVTLPLLPETRCEASWHGPL
ncbi:MAG: PAS domain-containing protein [Deltaproteobacteria bacterium]|nr:PAS domain-containing protein [Deltaproteobacteria bacterium]